MELNVTRVALMLQALLGCQWKLTSDPLVGDSTASSPVQLSFEDVTRLSPRLLCVFYVFFTQDDTYFCRHDYDCDCDGSFSCARVRHGRVSYPYVRLDADLIRAFS
jgi:hypothetical protein